MIAASPRTAFWRFEPPAPGSDVAPLARLTAGLAFLTLFAGGMVTSTGSGLAVPDWPLAFGTAFPSMVGGVLFEHGHRLIAGATALAVFALAWSVLRARATPLARGAARLAAALIVVQALLGGLTVLMKLPKPVSISHAVLGQTLFCLLLLVADEAGSRRGASGFGRLWRAGALALGAVYAQLFLGALLRHTGAGLAFHAAWAFAAAALVLRAAYVALARPAPASLDAPAFFMAAAVPLQVLLGLTAYLVKGGFWSFGFVPGAALVTAHLAVGAALLGACALWTLRAWRAR